MRITKYELKSTARTLARHRGFTVVAILSLGIAIGLNTTMYSVLDTLISPHIDLAHPEQLRRLWYFGDTRHKLDMRTKNAIFRSALEPFGELSSRVSAEWRALIESPEAYTHGASTTVAPNYFRVLGARTVKGRYFSDDDFTATTPPVVISERLERDLFPHGEESIGARIRIQGQAHIVIGVLSRESDRSSDAWVLPDAGTDLATLPLNMIRLRNAGDLQFGPAAAGVADRIAMLVGERRRDNALRVFGYAGGRFDVRALFKFTGFTAALVYAVFAVLLIACANLANLQLARGIARSRELATRAALGASRRDIVLHLLLETAVLAIAGVVLGIILAFWSMHLLRASIPETMGYYIVEPETSWRLFVFATLAGVFCMLLVGLFPALRVSRVDLNDLIKSGAGTGSTRRARRQYGVLIAAEIGFALVLVCGAALLVRAARQLDTEGQAWDQSMLTEGQLSVKLAPTASHSVADLSADLVSRMRAVPDIADATVIASQPDTARVVTVTDPGSALRVVPAPKWSHLIVSPSYLRTMGFEIAHGRDFREGEEGAAVIVDPQFARMMWPGADAVGRMVKFGSATSPGRWFTVVGVRKPVGIESVDATGPGIGSAYGLAMPEDQVPAANSGQSAFEIELVVRARRAPHRTPILVSAALAGDNRLTPTFLGTFDEASGAEAKRNNQRFVGFLFSLFAVLALALAALGVYGIVSHSVAERRREIGVRLALGSSARNILYVVLREGNVFLLAGTAIGLWLIRDMAGLVREFLQYAEADVYSVELYVPAAVFLFAVALVSAYIPARRATKIDPVEALRCE
ncbi:MAG: FtsX-like permease family protein [Gemmatimonadaceae bacterium]